MEDPDYERKLTRLRPSSPAAQAGGVLFVDGFSQCGVEFHLHSLLKLRWPACSKYLYSWEQDKPAELAQILEQSTFKMIVVSALCGSWQYMYERKYKQHKAALDRLHASLKAAVEQKGATLVLFCTEKTPHIYRELFGKTWQEGCYVRTSCFRTPAAEALLPAAAPREANAKAIHLTNVPESEAWYVTTSQSDNHSLLFRPDLGPGLASIAAGAAGRGRVVYVGDVNADEDTCRAIQQLAYALFPSAASAGRAAGAVAGVAGRAAGAAGAAAASAAGPAGPASGAAGGAGPGAGSAAGAAGRGGKKSHECAVCGKKNGSESDLKRCSRCKAVYYCSVDCQRADWPAHKPSCCAA